MKVGALLRLYWLLLGGVGASASQDVAATLRELAEFFERTAARFEQAAQNAGKLTLSAKDATSAPLTIGIVTSPSISGYAAASTKNWQQYADLHGYELKVVHGGVEEACGPKLSKLVRQKTGRAAPIWAKICLLRKLLVEPADHAGDEHHVMVVDADTFVQHPEFDVLDQLVHNVLQKDERAAGLMFDDRGSVNDYPGCWYGGAPPNGKEGICRPNTFLMLFRSGSDTLQFAESWLQQALGDCANEAKEFPPTQRVLWRCVLPGVEKEHPGWLHVMNGMTQYYTMSLQEPTLPLVHFEMDKGHLRSVTKAIARVQPSMDEQNQQNKQNK